MSDNIAAAWDKVKGKDDAPFAVASPDLKDELTRRADGISRKGVTTLEAMGADREPTVFDEFEDEYKRLSAKKPKAEAKAAPVAEPKVETKAATTAKAAAKVATATNSVKSKPVTKASATK